VDADEAMAGKEPIGRGEAGHQMPQMDDAPRNPMDWSVTADTDEDLELVNAAGSECVEQSGPAGDQPQTGADDNAAQQSSAVIVRPQHPGLARIAEQCARSVAHDNPAVAIMGRFSAMSVP
jgi:hypothetical protein